MATETGNNTRAVSVDLSVYSLECVKRAAYRFTDRFSLNIHVMGETAQCELVFDSKASSDAMEHAAASFQKELLDQDLRATIRKETEGVRNLILSHAFSRTGLTDG